MLNSMDDNRRVICRTFLKCNLLNTSDNNKDFDDLKKILDQHEHT